jgi:ATP phosphoribosyltransferase
MRVTSHRWQQIETAEEPLRLALSTLEGALITGKAFVTEPGSQEGKALAQALELGEQVQRAAAAKLVATRNFLQSGYRLVEVVNRIDEAVVREIIPKLKSFGAEGIVEYPLNKVVL